MITLFQPKYPHGRSQCYLPGGLMNLGSRLLQAGVEVSFFDLNFTKLESKEVSSALADSSFIGFSVLGHPYIPAVLENIRTLRTRGFGQTVLVGGEGVARLQLKDFLSWFVGRGLGNVAQIKNIKQDPNQGITEDADLLRELGIPRLDSQFATSMTPMLQRLPEPMRRRYLTSEFSLFISNGCKFSCEFCAAAKGRKEQYRTIALLRDEVEYICAYLQSITHPRLEVYLSTLDAFQNPQELEERLEVVTAAARKHSIAPHVRCLATSRCTVEAVRADPKLPKRLHSYGLRIVAFGADGADEATWKREKKTHNTLPEINEAVAVMQQAGILVELLMVIGFQKDKAMALWRSLRFSFRKARQGAVIRPYLGKSHIPSGRWTEGEPGVEACRRDPELLRHLDFAMVGSKVSHPSPKERWLSTLAYLLVIGGLAPFGLCPTRPLMPVPLKKGVGQKVTHWINRAMPFDR